MANRVKTFLFLVFSNRCRPNKKNSGLHEGSCDKTQFQPFSPNAAEAIFS